MFDSRNVVSVADENFQKIPSLFGKLIYGSVAGFTDQACLAHLERPGNVFGVWPVMMQFKPTNLPAEILVRKICHLLQFGDTDAVSAPVFQYQ